MFSWACNSNRIANLQSFFDMAKDNASLRRFTPPYAPAPANIYARHGVFNVNIIYTMNDKLDSEERKELPDSVFGLPERREFPMPDAAHVRAAESYFRYCPEELKPELARNILRRANEFGVDVKSPAVLAYIN